MSKRTTEEYNKERRAKLLAQLKESSFGYWIVIGDDIFKAKILCKCVCGKEQMVFHKILRNGQSTHCGCMPRKMASKEIDLWNRLENNTFGYWSVIGNKVELGQVLSRCICGSEKMVATWALTTGLSKSCGCKSSEMTKETIFSRYRVENVYDIDGVKKNRTH